MRSNTPRELAFVGGVLCGLTLGGVALLTVGAARRVHARRGGEREQGPFIDGVHESAAEREARISAQLNAPEHAPRLASELPEFAPRSQRW